MIFNEVLARYLCSDQGTFSREEVGIILSALEQAEAKSRELSSYKNHLAQFGLCALLDQLPSIEQVNELLMGPLKARRTALPAIQGTYAYDVTIGEVRSVFLTYKRGETWNFGDYQSEVWDEYPWEGGGESS